MINKVVGAVSAMAVLAGGVGAAVLLGAQPAGVAVRPVLSPPGRPLAPAAARLVAYGSCDQFLASVKAQALQLVGPYGIPEAGQPVFAMGPVDVAGGGPTRNATAGVPAGASTASAGASSPAFSGTNDQVAGVDEPDTVKTDGHIMAVVRQNPAGLQVAQVGGP